CRRGSSRARSRAAARHRTTGRERRRPQECQLLLRESAAQAAVAPEASRPPSADDRGLSRRAGGARLAELVDAERPALERVVAGGDVPVAERIERRILDVTVACLEARTARVEVARARRVQRARHVALE